jgi:hypothetical protein
MMIALARWIGSSRAEGKTHDAQSAALIKPFAEPKQKRSVRGGKNRSSRRER